MAGSFGARYRDWLDATEDVWIETGTYHGHGIIAALAYGFKELHSIEVSQKRFLGLETEKPDLCRDSRVHRYLGSSRQLLQPIVEQVLDHDVVFWLDAHFQGEAIEERDWQSECPLIDELRAIAAAPWTRSVVVCIDDWNFFTDAYWQRGSGREKFNAADWPRESKLFQIMSGWQSFIEDHILYFHKDFR